MLILTSTEHIQTRSSKYLYLSSCMLKSNHQCHSSGRQLSYMSQSHSWGHGGSLGSNYIMGTAIMNRTSDLIKQLLWLSCVEDIRSRHLHSRKWVLISHQICHCLKFGLPAVIAMRNNFIFRSLPSLWCFAIAQSDKQGHFCVAVINIQIHLQICGNDSVEFCFGGTVLQMVDSLEERDFRNKALRFKALAGAWAAAKCQKERR